MNSSRPSRGSKALPSCVNDTFGSLACKKAALIGAPATRPLPAVAGTVEGMEYPLPPSVLQLAALHCAALRLAVVQPIDSKPSTRKGLVEAATPSRAPKSPQVSLAMIAPRGFTPCVAVA